MALGLASEVAGGGDGSCSVGQPKQRQRLHAACLFQRLQRKPLFEGPHQVDDCCLWIQLPYL